MRARKRRAHAVQEILVTFDGALSLLKQHGHSITGAQLTSGGPDCDWCWGEVLYAVNELLLWAKSLVSMPPHDRAEQEWAIIGALADQGVPSTEHPTKPDN